MERSLPRAGLNHWDETMDIDFSPFVLWTAAHVAAVVAVVAAVWLRAEGWYRMAAALAGATAIWLPLQIQLHALGEPSLSPPTGKVMNLLGAFEDEAHDIYLFVDTERGETAPRMYKVKQVVNKYDDHQYHVQRQSYSQLLGVQVNLDETGGFEMVYLDYEMPDWDKDDMQRGYPTPIRRNN
jgi:hypothetical protein